MINNNSPYNYLILYIILIAIVYFILNFSSKSCYVNLNIENFQNTSRNIYLNYGYPTINRNKVDDNQDIYILKDFIYYNRSSYNGNLVKLSFFANVKGSITPLLFESINDKYICVAIGYQINNEIGLNNFEFLPKYGNNKLLKNRKYYFGWKNISTGVITYSKPQNDNNTFHRVISSSSNIRLDSSIIGKPIEFNNLLGDKTYSIFFSVKLNKELQEDIDNPTQIESPIKKAFLNILPSKVTCGEDENLFLTNIPTPDTCLQSLFKESGCTSNGSLWNDVSSNYFENQPNGVFKETTIKKAREILTDYSKAKIGTTKYNLCSAEIINDNKIEEKIDIVEIESDPNDPKNKNKVFVNNIEQIDEKLIDSTFKLRVVIQAKNIFGEPYDPKKNTFYLSLENLDPNCSIGSDQIKDTCNTVFLDNKNCESKFLYNYIKENKVSNYRLVLVPEYICNNELILIGKNTNFTFVKDKGKYYLKNLDNNMFINLFKNDKNFILTGEVLNNAVSNVDKLNSSIYNPKCKEDSVKAPPTQFVTCSINNDFNYYLLPSTEIKDSSSINFIFNNNGTFKIILEKFNSNGFVDNTFMLIYCDYNLSTGSFFEKKTIDNKTYNLHMVCFDSTKNRTLPNHDLDFTVEIIKYSTKYLMENSIYNI